MIKQETLEFYMLAIASFVETSASLYGERVRQCFVEDSQFCCWLEKVWLPKRLVHGRQLRVLVKKHWPDLDWDEAYLFYLRQAVALMDQDRHLETSASIALAHCLSERKTAMLAAAMARANPLCTQASLLQGISNDALRNCTAFRDAHERFDDWEQMGMVRRHHPRLHGRTMAGPVEIQRAFAAIQQSWYGPNDFLVNNYAGFRQVAENLLHDVWPIQEARRFMFVPYARRSALGYEAAGAMRNFQGLDTHSGFAPQAA
jgi:hypothetical protein